MDALLQRLKQTIETFVHSAELLWTFRTGSTYIESLRKRAEGGDAIAIYQLGEYYYQGTHGLRQNRRKALKLWLRSGELGCAAAYCSIGYAYRTGEGVERDVKKKKYYAELAAMGGDAYARHNIGAIEGKAGNYDRAVKHWAIAAAAGFDQSDSY